MICTKWGTITPEGWKKVEEVFNQEKFNAWIEGLTPLERFAVCDVIVASMQISITCQNSLEEMKEEVGLRRESRMDEKQE